MIKKTFNYLIFSGLTSIVGFSSTIYLTRAISPDEFGIIGLFMAIVYILPLVISFSTIGLVSINKVKMERSGFSDFSNKFLTFGFTNFSLIFILSTITGFFFKDYWLIFILLPILAFLMYISSFHNAELIQDGKSKTFGSYRLIVALISFLITFILISLFNLTWDGRLIALIVSELSVLIISIFCTFETIKKFVLIYDKEKYKEFFHFGTPLMIGLGAGWMLNQADNYIVLYFFTLKEVGIYTAAYSVGSVINTINQAATNAIVPKLYVAFEKKQGHKVIKKLNFYYSLIILCVSFIVGIGSFWYVPILFGVEYIDSAPIVLLISVAFGFNGIYRTSGGVIAFYKRNLLQMKLVYISAVLNIIVSILLVSRFGILSPAIGTVVAYMFLAYMSFYYGWKILKVEERVDE